MGIWHRNDSWCGAVVLSPLLTQQEPHVPELTTAGMHLLGKPEMSAAVPISLTVMLLSSTDEVDLKRCTALLLRSYRQAAASILETSRI